MRKGMWLNFKVVDMEGADKLNNVAPIVKEIGVITKKPSTLYWGEWERYFETTGAAMRGRCQAWSGRV